MLIFLDSCTGIIVWYKFIPSETKLEYLEGLLFLEENGYTILSVTLDGRRGIASIFKQYPTQYCQFHLQQTILKKVTRNPQTECGKALKYIATHCIKERWSEDCFTNQIIQLLETYSSFLKERNESGEYIHRSIRSAFRTIKTVLPYLFTYQHYSSLSIPNTTNHIDGGVNTKLKELVRLHRGMRVDRRNVLIEVLLRSLRKRGKRNTRDIKKN